MAFFKHLADNGEDRLDKHLFRKEKNSFSTFKRTSRCSPQGGKGLIRLPCFRIGNRWILTHGFWKPLRAEWPKDACALAETIRGEVLAREKQKNK